MEPHKIILIGGDHYNGLSLVRLFGKKGLHPYGIIVGETASNGFLKESKYWEKVWTVSDDSQIISILTENFGAESFKPVIIPWSDGAASTIDNNLNLLENSFILPSIGKKQSCLYDMMDKGRQVEFAHKCGLNIAESYEIDLEQPLSIDNIIFPCIGKPIVSCEGDKKDIKKIDNAKELNSYLEGLKNKGYKRILLQEYVTIEKEYDVEGFINRDQSTYFVSEKVRTWPNIGGPTAYAFSVNNTSLNAEIDKIIDYLREIKYSGLFDIEIFKVGDRYLFNEMNWRNSAVCFAALYSGVEYPLYWYYAVIGKNFVIRKPTKYGVYSMVELLDFQRVKHREMGLMTWLKDLKNSQAKAFYDKQDLRPLKKRFSEFLKRNHR